MHSSSFSSRSFSSILARLILIAMLVTGIAACAASSAASSQSSPPTSAPPIPTPTLTPAPTQVAHTSGEVLETVVVTDGSDAYLAPPKGFVYVALRLHITVGRDLILQAPMLSLQVHAADFGLADFSVRQPVLAPVPGTFEFSGWDTFLINRSVSAANLLIIFGNSDADSVQIPVSWTVPK